jgi:chromosome segregation ATPase
VVEVIDDLRQLQRETETALEQQCQQTEQERQLRCRMEKSLQAESQLREDAEASIQLYKDLIQQLKTDKDSAVSALSERNARVKATVATITTMLSDNSVSSENADVLFQLLASLARE